MHGEAPVEASVSDVSSDGLSLIVRGTGVEEIVAMRRWLRNGVMLHVEVTLGRHPVVLPGRVAWTRPIEGSREMLAGMRFEDVDTQTRKVLRAWLVQALAALQGAARHVLLERWDDAAGCLAAVGIDDAEPPTVSAVLRYAAASGVKAANAPPSA
jgi:hypothetical protein